MSPGSDNATSLREVACTLAMRVPVVEDEKKTASFIRTSLQAEQFAVDARLFQRVNVALARSAILAASVADPPVDI